MDRIRRHARSDALNGVASSSSPGESDGVVCSTGVGAAGGLSAATGHTPLRSPRQRSLSHRVFVTMLAVSLGLITVLSTVGAMFMQQRLAATTSAGLANEASIVAASLNSAPSHLTVLRRLRLDDTRVTLINADGDVLFDSDTDEREMEDHASRPEVEQALATGRGSAERASSTLGEVMLYEAVRLADGSVVRLSQAQASYLAVLSSLVGPVLLMAAVGVAASIVAARRASRRIIEPLLEVDLDHPRRSSQRAYAEMEPMLERIETQRQELKRQMRVLADNDRMRREFTANITHELKTPLTAISGYAELIAAGMVANEADQREFGAHIHEEAGRLTALVNDILTLSNLDEAEHGEAGQAGTLGEPEPIDVPLLLDGIAQRLDAVAAQAEVRMELRCDSARVIGVARLVDAMIYNLASNAIRYNRPGGLVELGCGVDEDGRVFVRVRDTGIGIAPEEQGKIFERFYRVDKSRSKARGGTGLGLAIVKHAALYHHAALEVESELGVGTSITVRFAR